MAEKVENRSGEPFPNARKVTPATFSFSPSVFAIVARLGQKKSEAQMPGWSVNDARWRQQGWGLTDERKEKEEPED